VPLNDLLEGVVVTAIAREGVRKQQSTERISTTIGTMGIHFSSIVVGCDVDIILLDITSNLIILFIL
jgi:hypothetical protein